MNAPFSASPGFVRLSGVVLQPNGIPRSIELSAPVPSSSRRLRDWLAFFLPFTLTHSQDTRNAAANAVLDRLNNGTARAQGAIKIYDDVRLTLLADIPMGNPAFLPAVNGIALGNGLPWSDLSANATGTAQEFDAVDRDESVILSGHVRTSGHELNFPDLEINTNYIVKILAASYTAAP